MIDVKRFVFQIVLQNSYLNGETLLHWFHKLYHWYWCVGVFILTGMFVRYRAASMLRMEWVLFRSVSSMEPSFCPQCFCLQLWSKIWAVNGPSSSLWAVMWHIPLETLRRAGVCISLPFVLTGFFAEYKQPSIFIYSNSSKCHYSLCKCETVSNTRHERTIMC